MCSQQIPALGLRLEAGMEDGSSSLKTDQVMGLQLSERERSAQLEEGFVVMTINWC